MANGPSGQRSEAIDDDQEGSLSFTYLAAGMALTIAAALLIYFLLSTKPGAQAGNPPPVAKPNESAGEDSQVAASAGSVVSQMDARSWDDEPLGVVPHENQPTAKPEDQKVGPPETIEGMQTQRLKFPMPSTNAHLWSPDGNVLYVAGADGLSRIDTSTWQCSHHFNQPAGRIVALAYTSAGIVAAVRNVDHMEKRGLDYKDRPTHLIDKRTGVAPETFSVRILALVDPNDLHILKQYNGPALLLAGSPKSPVLCASDQGMVAKLIDIRTGAVLHVAGRMKSNGSRVDPTVTAGGFEELLMSADGRFLLHRSFSGKPMRTDISGGKFAESVALQPYKSDNVSRDAFDRPTMFLSPDGTHLAIYDQGNGGPDDATYSVIDIAKGDIEDVDQPYPAPNSTAFAFVGPDHRPVINSGRLQVSSSAMAFESYALTLPRRGESETNFSIFKPKARIENAVLSGSPFDDHVLMADDHNGSAWVKLPPFEPETLERLKLRPATAIKGSAPETPLELKVHKAEPSWRLDDSYTGVEIPKSFDAQRNVDGKRIYVLCSDGTIYLFDTDRLRELRRVRLPSAFRFHMTAAGPLIETEQGNLLLDRDTLDAVHVFKLPKDSEVFVTSPGSDAIGVISRLNDVSLYNVRTGTMIARITGGQLDRFAPPEAREKYHDARLGDLAISNDGSVLGMRYRYCHLFSILENGVKHIGAVDVPALPPPAQRIFPDVFPVPEMGFCYIRGYGAKVLKFPNLEDTNITFPTHEGEIPWSVAPDGTVYINDPQWIGLNAYNSKGKLVATGKAIRNAPGGYQVLVTLPSGPSRVFGLAGEILYLVDLHPPDETATPSE